MEEDNITLKNIEISQENMMEKIRLIQKARLSYIYPTPPMNSVQKVQA